MGTPLMVRVGQKVSTPHGPAVIMGFSRRRPGWDLWVFEFIDPVLGRCWLTDMGPFVAVLIQPYFCATSNSTNAQTATVRAVRYDDLNLRGRLGEQATELLLRLVGGDRDL